MLAVDLMNATSRFAVVPVLAFVLASSFANESCRGDWPFPLFRPNGAPRIDVIGPLGNRLPESYRRQYNRPTYLGGKVAAVIAPSSQEAMAWQKAETLGLYDKNGIKGRINGYKCPPQRVEQHYFYPKPWEVLQVGPRQDSSAAAIPNPIRLNESESESVPPGTETVEDDFELRDGLKLEETELMELPEPQLELQD